MHTTSKKFPLLSWLQYLCVSPSAVVHYLTAIRENKQAFSNRIQNRDNIQHPDHFEQLLGPDDPFPTQKELHGLEMSCQHLIIAGFEPVSTNFLCCIAFSLQNPVHYQRLVDEIRSSFTRYEDITADSLISLKLLNATIMEELRLAVIAATGTPRISPGAPVDGCYIPKGVSSSATYSISRLGRGSFKPTFVSSISR